MVVGDVTTGTDVLVVGGGPGGYVAAIRAAQLGLDTTLVEKDAYGGTCLNYGCIPSKALISATDVAHDAGQAEEMGVFANPAIDVEAMMEWKDGVVTRLTRGVESLCKNAGVELFDGIATFTGETEARIAHSGEGQGSETIAFEHAIVATEAGPSPSPGSSSTANTFSPRRTPSNSSRFPRVCSSSARATSGWNSRRCTRRWGLTSPSSRCSRMRCRGTTKT
jgi:dihydrolipoamide dehydrogenase